MNKLTSKTGNQGYPNIHSVLLAKKKGKVYYEIFSRERRGFRKGYRRRLTYSPDPNFF
jgi:hypothetical protein